MKKDIQSIFDEEKEKMIRAPFKGWHETRLLKRPEGVRVSKRVECVLYV